jgi:serine/threonine-protein kinase
MGDEEHGGTLRLLAGFSVGSRIAGYRLEEQIGQGGTAVVFRAQDERLHRQVALKILAPALASDDEFRHRFIRESRSAAAVDDPHIIPVYEAGDANGVLFIAMRYVPSGDAGTLVRRLGPLPIPQATAMISAVASALDAAHAAGLVHRDVKPANMLVDSRPGRPDHVYLSDFGLTKGGQASATQTGTGHFLGTPTYCAPEQIRGQPVDARADEYALACAAFMLLSGEPPFLRDEGLAVLYAQMSEPPPRLTSRRRDLPAAVDDVLVRALAKVPQDRYASCGEFADDLRAASGLQRYDSDVAVVLHQRALTDQQRKLGLDQADALASRASVAAARQEASRSDEAVVLHQQTLTDQRRALGREHPDTLTTRFSIAQEMAARGEHTAAEGELRAVLAIRERMLGPEHPDTLATRFSIAREIAARGAHTSAEDEFRIVLAARQRTLGPEHPDTLATRFSIAREMSARGRHDAAETEFRALLAARQRTLGRDHADTLATSFSIAQEMAARGDHTGAEDEFRAVLPHLERRLGLDHPVTLTLWFSIAREMSARGDHAGAEDQFRDILPHLKRKLGPHHPDTLAVAEWIAREMAARGDHAGAEEVFRDVIAARQRTLGPDTRTR